MTVGILKFNLPEEAVEFEIACKGPKLLAAIHSFFQNDLRPVIKYGLDDVERAYAERWRDALVERLKEEGVLDLTE